MESAAKQENPSLPPVSEALLLLHCISFEYSLHKEACPSVTKWPFLLLGTATPTTNSNPGWTQAQVRRGERHGEQRESGTGNKLHWRTRSNKRPVVLASTSPSIKYKQ